MMDLSSVINTKEDLRATRDKIIEAATEAVEEVEDHTVAEVGAEVVHGQITKSTDPKK